MGKRRRKAAMGRARYPTFAVTDALGVRGVTSQRSHVDPAITEWFSPRDDGLETLQVLGVSDTNCLRN